MAIQGSVLFKREIQLIQSEDYRDFVKWYFDTKVGKWFWASGASSSGKYHPVFAQGEGGLVRHTRSVAMVCEELMRLNTYWYMRDEYKDYARIACLLHDTCKYGAGDEICKDDYRNHGALAAGNVDKAWIEFFEEPAPELLTMAIRSHMGQWVENKEDRPFTTLDRLVHLADYIASRSFWDIPTLTAEYEQDIHPEDIILDDSDLPF